MWLGLFLACQPYCPVLIGESPPCQLKLQRVSGWINCMHAEKSLLNSSHSLLFLTHSQNTATTKAFAVANVTLLGTQRPLFTWKWPLFAFGDFQITESLLQQRPGDYLCRFVSSSTVEVNTVHFFLLLTNPKVCFKDRRHLFEIVDKIDQYHPGVCLSCWGICQGHKLQLPL